MKALKRWADYSTDEIKAVIRELPVAILPLGAVEEHGPHLPVGTDNFVIDSIAERVAEKTGCLLLPVLCYGQVWSLARFPGSLTLREETLRLVLIDLAEALYGQGIRGMAVLSGHLGNATAMRDAARTLHDLHADLSVQTITYPGLVELARGVVTSRQWYPGYIHAEEIETSLMLALAPDRVRMERAVADYPPLPPDFAVSPVRWSELDGDLTGVFGDATAATQAKGEVIVTRLENVLIDLIESLKSRVRAARKSAM